MKINSKSILLFTALFAILSAGKTSVYGCGAGEPQFKRSQGSRGCCQPSFLSSWLREATYEKTVLDSEVLARWHLRDHPTTFTVSGKGSTGAVSSSNSDPGNDTLQSFGADLAWVDRGGILRDYSLLVLSQQLLLMRWSQFRDELKGPFFADYVNSVTHLKRSFWDGDHWFWDGVMHPIQGGITYHVARSRGASDLESFAWGLGYSITYELSPMGQAGIGNIRVSPIDLMVTPMAGMAWAKLEYWLDGKIAQMNDATDKKILRSLLPAHVITNLLRFRAPWDRRALE